jgi:hypothetical protein
VTTPPPHDQRLLAFVKISAFNFGTTVYDTDDLSTVRGSSLTLLRAPGMLIDHLQNDLPPTLCLDLVYAAASECLFTLYRGGQRPLRRADTEPPREMKKQQWKKLLEKVKAPLRNGAKQSDLLAGAEQILSEHGPLTTKSGKPLSAETIANQIYNILGGNFELTPETGAAVDAGEAGAVIDRALAFLQRAQHGWPFDLFTFIGAWYIPESAKQPVPEILAALDTRLRTRQLRGLALPVPSPATQQLPPAHEAVCRLTGVLAVDPKTKRRQVSSSVDRRRRSGRKQKQDFYGHQLKIAADRAKALTAGEQDGRLGPAAVSTLRSLGTIIDRARSSVLDQDVAFAASFLDIVGSAPSDLPVSVRGKLCVVYLDGNGFGKARDRQCDKHGLAGLSTMSSYWEALGGGLLAKLLCWMGERPDIMLNSGQYVATRDESPEADPEGAQRYRFETLLWGGDEMCFVVPAWAGWAFLEELTKALTAWVEPGASSLQDRFHFSIGAAFGSVKTPIRDLRAVAESLADAAKAHDRGQSLVQVLALEGIDRAEFDLAAYRAQALALPPGERADGNWFSLPAEQLGEVRKAAARLIGRDGIGRSQLHRWLYKASSQGLLAAPEEDAGAGKLLAEMDRDFRRLAVRPEVEEALTGDRFAAAGKARPFLGLYQLGFLYDYLTALDSLETTGSAAKGEDAAA